MDRRDPSPEAFAAWRLTHPPMAGAEEPGNTETTTTAETAAAGKTFTQADLDQIVKDRVARERNRYGDYDALKAKATELDQLKTASQSDLERLTGERDTLKGSNTSLAAQNLRLKVALKKGLVGDKAVLADRLSGDTEEAMEADADELLKLFGGGSTGFDGGVRGDAAPTGDMDALIRRASGRT